MNEISSFRQRALSTARRRLSLGGAAALTVCAALSGTGTANAAPVSYLAGAVAQTSDGFDVNYQQQITANAARTYAPNASQHESVRTSANLATGEIHAFQESIAVNSPNGMGAYGTATIADSFRHLSGLDPFLWNSTTQATFNIHIDGNESLSPGQGDVFNFAQVGLIIYKPGTLDNFIPYCGDTVIKSFFWTIGAEAQPDDPCGNAPLANLSGAVNEDLSVAFAPGGDFDWAFVIVVGGGFNANLQGNNGNAHWLQDFGNTASLRYVAPDGSTVSSGSGVFPGTLTAQDVPEPRSLALVGLALAGVAGSRRTRRRATGA